jgi:Raf kinase inhibitor-like YbhB/YbcL family protein
MRVTRVAIGGLDALESPLLDRVYRGDEDGKSLTIVVYFSSSRHSLTPQMYCESLNVRRFIICFLLVLALPLTQLSLTADASAAPQDAGKQEPRKKSGETQSADTLRLTSSSFEADAAMPAKYACDGTDISPALAWIDPPAATQSFALIVDDPDAPNKTVVHWVIYEIPAGARMLPEGVPTDAKLHDGSRQGKNDHGKIGYSGPCPPHGAVHHYFFKLYALDTKTNLKPKATKPELEQAMKAHILAKAELIGRFEH